jgi:integrase
MRSLNSFNQSSSYIFRSHHTFYFRLCIPVDIQGVFGKKEIRYSLRTSYLGEAKRKAGMLAEQIHKLIKTIRRMDQAEMSNELTPEKIQELVTGWVRKNLKAEEEERTRPYKRLTESKLDDKYNAYDWVQTLHREELALGRHIETMAHSADILLEDQGIELSKDSDSYHQLCRDILKASIPVFEVEKERIYGDYATSGTDEQVVEAIMGKQVQSQHIAPESNAGQLVEEHTILLEDLYEDFKAKKIEAKRWSSNTVRNHQPKFNAFLQSVSGNIPVNTVTKKMAIRFSKLLDNLPPRFTDWEEYKDLKGIDPDSLKGKHKKTMDPTTKRDYLLHISSLMKFAENFEYIGKNPFKGLVPDKKKKQKELVEPFTLDDLNTIFHPDNYPLNGKKAHKFWLPVMALYTGCRLEEISQLYIEDVYQEKESGLWVLDINNEKDKKVKNEASIRLVPLHPFLVDDLKFPEFVQRVKEQGHERVFWELKKYNNKYGHKATEWFGKYKKEVGIKAPPRKKVFHSFRHSLSTNLNDQGVFPHTIDELTGHAHKGTSLGVYIKDFKPKNLLKAIKKLNYEIDLSHLKSSKYVAS